MSNYSGSITTANTSQVAAPSNQSRDLLIFQNNSDTGMFLGLGSPAVADAGIYVAPATSFQLVRLGGSSVGSKLFVICAVAGKKYTCSDDAVVV